jgi:hypothetical protein
MRKLTLILVVLCGFVGVFSSTLCAQATDGNLVGAVEDASGAAVGGASTQLVNVTTGVVRAAVTDASGLYRYNNLPAGIYKLTATATGFSAVTLQDVLVDLNKTTTANITLHIGAIATQVEVTDAPTLIDTTTAQISSIFNTR